jgi:hypothetical protein
MHGIKEIVEQNKIAAKVQAKGSDPVPIPCPAPK